MCYKDTSQQNPPEGLVCLPNTRLQCKPHAEHEDPASLVVLYHLCVLAPLETLETVIKGVAKSVCTSPLQWELARRNMTACPRGCSAAWQVETCGLIPISRALHGSVCRLRCFLFSFEKCNSYHRSCKKRLAWKGADDSLFGSIT